MFVCRVFLKRGSGTDIFHVTILLVKKNIYFVNLVVIPSCMKVHIYYFKVILQVPTLKFLPHF